MFRSLIIVLLFALSAPAQQFELQQVLHCPEQNDGAEFGMVMAVDDDDALIYANFMQNYMLSSIYFYHRDPKSRTWTYLQRIFHRGVDAQYGFAISKHVALIPDNFIWYLYGRVAPTADGWQILQTIRPPAGMRFAWSGDIDDDLIVLAAQQSQDGQSYDVAKEVALVYRFNRPSSQVTLLDTLAVPDNPWIYKGHFTGFGSVVRIYNHKILITAPLRSENPHQPGGAYLFINRPQQEAQWELSDTFYDVSPIVKLGHSAALDDKTVLLGAYASWYNPASEYPKQGASLIYSRTDSSGWQKQKLDVFDWGDFRAAWFGYSVDLADSVAFIATPRDYSGFAESGSVSIYKRSKSNIWQPSQILRAPQPHTGDMFGMCLAASMPYLFVCNWHEDEQASDVGVVYIYSCRRDTAITLPDTTVITIPDTTVITPVVPQQLHMSLYPNPATNHVYIKYALPQAMSLSLTVYNYLGEQIRRLAVQNVEAGEHVIQWDCTNDRNQAVPSGIYFCRLSGLDDQQKSVRKTAKITVLRD